MKKFIEQSIIYALFIIEVVVQAFIFKIMWLWFIVPVFKIDEITLVQAIGLKFIISLFRFNSNVKGNYDFLKLGIASIIYSITIFFLAWIFHLIAL